MHEIDDIFKISKSSIENHLHQLDYVSHFDVWVSHKLRGQGVGGVPALGSAPVLFFLFLFSFFDQSIVD